MRPKHYLRLPIDNVRRIIAVGAALCILFMQGFTATAAAQYAPPSQADVNAIYNWPFWNPNVCVGNGSASTAATVLIGNDNPQKIFNFFIGKGLSPAQAAGVLGNIEQESAFDPTKIQNGGDSQDPNAAGGGGWGLVQWTPGASALTVQKQYNVTGNIYDLATQLTMIWSQMTNTSPVGVQNMVAGLKGISGNSSAAASQAASYFVKNYEGGTDPNGIREQYAQQILQEYGSGTAVGAGATTGNNLSGCGGSVAVNCKNPASGAANLSATRQNVVCIAQQELALWMSQPNYGKPYPGFPYAATGYLKYSQNRAEEWCADFASWVYEQAQDPLQSPDWNIAYVPNIQAVGQSGGKFHWHPAGSGYIPKPGDLAIHGANHVNIFISYSGGVSTYIGGDQGSGPYPGGSVVSTDQESGYWAGGDITGYVSPD